MVLQINQNEPSEAFAQNYLAQAKQFLETIKSFREGEVRI
jgi:sulfite reductase (ferredoxin)